MQNCRDYSYSIILQTKRWNKEIDRRRKRKERRRRGYSSLRGLARTIVAEKSHSRVLKFLFNRKFIDSSFKVEGDTAIVQIPEIFSFIDNPDDSIKVLKKLVALSCDQRVRALNIDHGHCMQLDICASLLTDIILYDILRLPNRNLRLGGTVPSNDSNNKVAQMLSTSGVLKHFGPTKEWKIPENIKVLDFYDEYIKTDKNIESGLASTEIVDYLNRCYNTVGYEVNIYGKQALSEIIGEIIDNCGEHCGDEIERWVCHGHYFLMSDGNSKLGEVQLVIANFGNTIYEGMQVANDLIKLKLEKSYQSVFGNNLNFLFKKSKDKELSYTLHSLQDGISRKFDAGTNPDRGSGTVKLFTHFQEIGRTDSGLRPQLSVTSGNSHIVFNGEYKMEKNLDGRYVIAFNETNDLNVKPDGKYVYSLKNKFPGTVITLKFYLDEKYLEKIIR